MNHIVIVDFGGQYTHLIARRIRECGVYSKIVSPTEFELTDYTAGIIFSGGPQSVTEEDMLSLSINPLNCPVPLLGICYGHQLIAKLCNGIVSSGKSPEYGETILHLKDSSELLSETAPLQKVWMSHTDSVTELPQSFSVTASTAATAIAAYEHKTRPLFGVQFHPEVTHSKFGKQILQNFIMICKIDTVWNVSQFTEEIISGIQFEAGDKNLFVLLSGGVDSLVAMAAAVKAIGTRRVFAVHIDTGFMRLNESQAVMKYSKKFLSEHITLTNASADFYKALKNVVEPEIKREIIGALFVEVMQNTLNTLNFDPEQWLLVQGTIYPDTIESGASKHSGKIKTHHNTVKEIQQLIDAGKVVEPLRDLYKDEVRILGKQLGLPDELIERKPFPGPGLAIRILCTDNSDDTLFTLSEQEKNLLQEITDPLKLYAELLPIRSVGVQGDLRTYKHPICLYSSEGILPSIKELKKCSQHIVNVVHSVNRTVVCLTPYNGTWILRKQYADAETVNNLQIVDYVITECCKEEKQIWQMPVIALPLFDSEGKQVFVMRPVVSEDAMSADVFEASADLILKIIDRVREIPFVAALLYDLTTKPPGTIEWE